MSPLEEDWDSTLTLLSRARAGDATALNDLFARYVPVLQRWASGRLPGWARDLTETHDLVQDALLRSFKNVEGFEHRGEGAFHAYLRQAVMNRIRDEVRRASKLPPAVPLEDVLPDPGRSPLHQAIGKEAVEQYDKALTRLTPDERELIVARFELGLTYAEIASVTDKPSPDAARMAISRAVIRLAQELGESLRLVD